MTAPVHSFETFLVIMLTTPPMASEPYNVDAGPRMTSIRSIADIGGIKLLFDSPNPFGVMSPVLF
ncbi:hypothetical protein D3C80_1912010 [compost metagenome]